MGGMGAIDGYAEINGTRLYYERRGHGPTVLFIHGAALDHRNWAAQVEGLADRFDVITYDLRGYGRSAAPTGEFKHYEDAAALLDHLAIQRAIAVGHSIGGLYALELALARPDRVAGLVALCMSGLSTRPFPPDVIEMFAAVRRAAYERGVDAAKAVWRACGWFASARARPDVAAQVDAMLADYTGWYWTHDNPARNLDPPSGTRLEDVRVPTLIVDGGLDLDYNHANADELARRIAGATLLRLPDAGHMAQLEDPDAFARALDELAARIARTHPAHGGAA